MCNYFIQLFLLLFIISLHSLPIQAYRIFDDDGVDIIMAIENEEVNMECKTDAPITYCGFSHSGSRYSLAGAVTSVGKCSITIKATINQTGEWRCHIGSQAIGEQSMKTIDLRVVKELAAVEKNIIALHSTSKTIYCATIRGFIPLLYCRFEPPKNLPFGIDSSVTKKRPLLERYYFPENKSLNRGDCAVTINTVNYDDAGTWICGAGLDDGAEHIDIIDIKVEGYLMLPSPAITVIVLFASAAALILISLSIVACQKRGMRAAPLETHELEHINRPAAPEGTGRPTSRPGTPELRPIPTVIVHSPSDPGMSSALMPVIDE